MAGPKSLKGHRPIVRWSLIILVAILVIGGLGLRFQFNEYAITPGHAEDVAPLITIAGHDKPAVQGQILLTDVFLTKINWLTWIQTKFTKDAQIIPTSALVAPGVPSSELTAQGFLEMAHAKDQARAAALTRLGYAVTAKASGAQISQVALNAPAWNSLHVGDVITQANGRPVTSSCGLISALHDAVPSTKVPFTVLPARFSSSGSLSLGSPEHLSIRVSSPRGGALASACPGSSRSAQVYLGIGISSYVSYDFPFSIAISTPNIGGPSAGLAMTLGIIDQLSQGKLLLRRTIAATGTMDAMGNVGDVGGVPQKAVTVQRAGARIFLVPVGEVGPARSTTGEALDVRAVASLDAALGVFAHLGGHIALANGQIVSPTTHPSGQATS
jgi:PDZ domain-containing protein